jgi:DNA-directed RNA polymerase alpha subunit
MIVKLFAEVQNNGNVYEADRVHEVSDALGRYLIKIRVARELDSGEQSETEPNPSGTPLPDGFVKPGVYTALKEAGYKTLESVSRADKSELVKLDGIGRTTATRAIETAIAILDGNE